MLQWLVFTVLHWSYACRPNQFLRDAPGDLKAPILQSPRSLRLVHADVLACYVGVLYGARRQLRSQETNAVVRAVVRRCHNLSVVNVRPEATSLP